MQWHSVAEFFAMGGYAVYVWGSLGACALGMLLEPWLLARRRQRILLLLQRRRLTQDPDRPAQLDELNELRGLHPSTRSQP